MAVENDRNEIRVSTDQLNVYVYVDQNVVVPCDKLGQLFGSLLLVFDSLNNVAVQEFGILTILRRSEVTLSRISFFIRLIAAGKVINSRSS